MIQIPQELAPENIAWMLFWKFWPLWAFVAALGVFEIGRRLHSVIFGRSITRQAIRAARGR